jgi:hypothetical protein
VGCPGAARGAVAGATVVVVVVRVEAVGGEAWAVVEVSVVASGAVCWREATGVVGVAGACLVAAGAMVVVLVVVVLVMAGGAGGAAMRRLSCGGAYGSRWAAAAWVVGGLAARGASRGRQPRLRSTPGGSWWR